VYVKSTQLRELPTHHAPSMCLTTAKILVNELSLYLYTSNHFSLLKKLFIVGPNNKIIIILVNLAWLGTLLFPSVKV
jgi:hypothetical protein